MSGVGFVPSDDGVRDIWRDAMTQTSEYFDAMSPADADERFDRWLTAHDARIASEAAEAERDRLLELAKTTPLSLMQVINREIALEQWAEYADRLENEREGAGDE